MQTIEKCYRDGTSEDVNDLCDKCIQELLEKQMYEDYLQEKQAEADGYRDDLMSAPQIPECQNCKKFLARIQELEEDLDRKENYVYHARDRSRED